MTQNFDKKIENPSQVVTLKKRGRKSKKELLIIYLANATNLSIRP